MAQAQKITDDELRALASSGRIDLADKLSDEDARRLLSLVKQSRSGGGAQSDESRKRVEQLRADAAQDKPSGLFASMLEGVKDTAAEIGSGFATVPGRISAEAGALPAAVARDVEDKLRSGGAFISSVGEAVARRGGGIPRHLRIDPERPLPGEVRMRQDSPENVVRNATPAQRIIGQGVVGTAQREIEQRKSERAGRALLKAATVAKDALEFAVSLSADPLALRPEDKENKLAFGGGVAHLLAGEAKFAAKLSLETEKTVTESPGRSLLAAADVAGIGLLLKSIRGAKATKKVVQAVEAAAEAAATGKPLGAEAKDVLSLFSKEAKARDTLGDEAKKVLRLLSGEAETAAPKKLAESLDSATKVAVKSTNAEEVTAVKESIDVAADKVASSASDVRTAGLDDLADRAKKYETDLDRASRKIADSKAAGAQKQMDEIVEAPRTKADEASVARAEVQRSSESGRGNTELITRMATSIAGGSIAQAVSDNDGKFAAGPFLFGAIGGFLVGTPQNLLGRRFVVRKGADIVADTASLKKAQRAVAETGGKMSVEVPDFEKSIGIIKEMLPDRLIDIGAGTSRTANILGRGAGALIGATTMGGDPDRGFNPAGAAFGAVAGFGLAHAGLNFQFKGKVNFRKTYERWIEEFGELSADLRPQAKIFRREDNARRQEIWDTANVLRRAPTKDATIITDYLDGNIGVFAVPKKWRAASSRMRFLFDEFAVQLVNLGAAEGKLADTLMSNLGTYVPRLYLEFEKTDDLLLVGKWLRDSGEPLRRISDQKYFMRRGDIPADVRRAWGEINRDNPNPAFILGRRGPVLSQDIATHEFMNFVAASSDHRLSDDLVHAATEAAKGDDLFASVTQDVRLFTRGTGRKAPPVEHAEHAGKIYRRLPDTPRFGVLKGKYVEEGTADYIQSVYEHSFGMNQFVAAPTALFKASKVTFNPATLFRNWYGQIPLSDFGGVSPWDLHRWIPSINNYARQNANYLEARKAGLFGGEWFGQEVQALLQVHRSSQGSILNSGMNWVAKIERTQPVLAAGARASGAPFRAMRRVHQASEHMFKQTMYDYARSALKLSPPDATEYALRFAFDYQDVPRWINFSRKSVFGAPFVSFSYKAMPRVLANAMAVGNPKELLKFWKYPAALAAYNEASHRKHGLVPEDKRGFLPTIRRLALNTMGLGVGKSVDADNIGFQRFLPDWSGDQQILLRHKDNFGRFLYKDMTYWLPWGDVGEVGKGNLGKNLAKVGIPFPKQLEPSHPFLNLGIAAWSNRDAFTGRQIIPDGTTGADNALFIFRHLGKQFGPQLFGYQMPKIMDAIKGDVMARPDQPDVPTALKELIGSRDKPVDPRTSIEFRIRDLKHERGKIDQRNRILAGKLTPQDVLDKNARASQKIDEEIKRLEKEKRTLPDTPKSLRMAKKDIERRGRKRSKQAKRKAKGK